MWKKISNSTIFIFILALIIRLFFIYLPAQPYDINTYHAWGNLLLKLGPTNFFKSTWCDYLPLPVYLFAFIAKISQSFQLNFDLVFKLFFSTLELSLLFWLFKLTKQFYSHTIHYSLFTILLLFSPALIFNTSWWGQTDSLPALLAVVSVVYFSKFIINNNSPTLIHYSLFTLLFSLAISFKPIIILILPIFVILYFQKFKVKNFPLLFAILFSLSIFIFPALFINPNPLKAFQFLFNKTLEQASTYPYTSINAFNFWNIRSSLTIWPADNQSLLGLTYQRWGMLLFSILSLNLFRFWRQTKWNQKHAFRVIATIFILFFTFTTRMHERHLLFALPFLALATITTNWLLIPYLFLTITYSFNLWMAYSWVIHHQTWPTSIFWANLSSTITTLTALSLATIWSYPQAFKKIKSWLASHKVLFLILVFASFTRFYHLGFPPTHIFDEVYHAFTAQELLKNNLSAWTWWTTPPKGFAYEWTHPPIAKYFMVFGLEIWGNSSFGWRFFSVIFGILVILGIYYLAYKFFSSSSTANLSAFLVSLEGINLVQSRIAMNDIYMLAFFIWSLVLALHKRWKPSAILYGLALASKWSALYGLIPLSFIYLFQFWNEFKHHFIFHFFNSLRLISISLLTYFLSYAPFLLSGFTLDQLWELHRQMWYYHTHLVATHAYQSTPLQWIFSLRPVWYWVQYSSNNNFLSNIYLQSNPLLLWLGLIAVINLIPQLLSRFKLRLSFLLYFIFTIPWIFSPRIMFFYHYLPSATFLMIILAYWLNSLPIKLRYFLITLGVIFFALLTPIFYGCSMPQTYWQHLFIIFPTWK